MKPLLRISVAAALLLLVPAAGEAQSPAATGSAASRSASGTAAGSAPRSEISKKCSAEADAKGLHGKERRKFRTACKRGTANSTGTS